ncbi:Uncharacterized protein BM_BM2796 [Brugia malayi]|uniref:Bm2796, isoform f n=1 Tax=Brugia malayi TaxID=6279 RepID=A0A1P6BVK1_BRUMA|nr:Uncharacterized protein BM_BM2796 [Brugia malayi]CDQ03364.1 Bm2796, isoform f [Brugia malayi]VIO90042.1 Uncharacterized protein BM_BM2796 [Brugia malayi]
MEIMRNGYCAIKSAILAVIEWRSAASAPYFMFINSAFWWSVFYLDKGTQLRLLISFAAGVFSWDILLSSTYDRSILCHILTWPIRSVLRTASVVMALYSAKFLYLTEFEKACWSAYSAVGLLMINPVWLYYQIPQKINECLYTVCITTKYIAEITIISPFCKFYRILDYIIRLKWLIAILEKIMEELLRIKATVRSIYVATITKLCVGKNAVLNVTISTLFNLKNFILCTVYEFRMAVINGIVFLVMTTRNGILNAIMSTRNGIVFIITFLKDGIFFGYLTLKNGLIGMILRLKHCLNVAFIRSKDALYYTIIAIKNYIHYTFVTVQNSILNFFSALIRWIKTKIVKPIRNACRAIIQFLQYWLFAHWWPSLKSWFILNITLRLQLLFNYFCFGLVYIFHGYWFNPFIVFLSRYFKCFYNFFQQSILNPVKIWIKHQIDKVLVYIKRLLRTLAIRVRDSILWPFFVLLISLMHKVCAQLYRILLQPVIDILYEKYKVCEDYLLIYCLGPVCQVVVNHIPERSPFCDDTDTELADLLPPGFSNEEESDIEEASDKPSLPSRSLSPFTEDERDFVRGLKFPNLDSSDSSEAEFALRTKSNSQKSLRKRPKIHPKDPAPSTCSDKLISRAHKTQNDENKYKRSSSTSSHSESMPSSSAQNASDDANLQNLDAFDFESESCPGAEFQRDTVEIQKLEDSNDERSNDRKQNMDQKKMGEIEVCCAEQMSLATVFKDDSFEILDK